MPTICISIDHKKQYKISLKKVFSNPIYALFSIYFVIFAVVDVNLRPHHVIEKWYKYFCVIFVLRNFTWSFNPWHDFFWGTVLNAQSCFVFWRNPGRAGMCITSFSSSEPPASTISTVDVKSSESRFARTHPADPAPTIKRNNNLFELKWALPV